MKVILQNPRQRLFTMKQAESIKQFCTYAKISVATFYRNRNDMPRITKIGSQSRILPEDRDEWTRRKRQQSETETTA